MTSTSIESKAKRFLVEYIDQSTGSVVADAVLCARSMADLCKIVDPECSNIEAGFIYDLDTADLEQIKRESSISLEIRGGLPSNVARLRTWLPIDDLPYRVHTNRELFLMLEGTKPLSVFSEDYPNDTGREIIPESRFSPHVESNIFSKKEFVETTLSARRSRFVLYSMKSETWRIEAYILLLQTAKKSGWNEGFERMEGSLLGYEEWQNDAYLEMIYRPNLARQAAAIKAG